MFQIQWQRNDQMQRRMYSLTAPKRGEVRPGADFIAWAVVGFTKEGSRRVTALLFAELERQAPKVATRWSPGATPEPVSLIPGARLYCYAEEFPPPPGSLVDAITYSPPLVWEGVVSELPGEVPAPALEAICKHFGWEVV